MKTQARPFLPGERFSGRKGCEQNVKVIIYMVIIQGVFLMSLPLKCPSTEKLFLARLGVSWTIYVNVDSPNLGFPYFNFLEEAQ